MPRFVQLLYRILSSYALAIIVLALLLLLTFLGTVDQVRLGLYEVQRRYFTSLFFWYEAGPVRIPLPGVYLLAIVFCINLLLGGVLRMRRRWANAGLYVIHAGMFFLMFAALVTHEFAVEGNMALGPGQSGSRFESYHDWELAVAELPPAASPAAPGEQTAATRTEYIVPMQAFNLLRGTQTRVLRAGALPFEIVAGHYERNAQVLPKGPMFEAPLPVVDGFFVMPKRPEPENERNMPALYVTLRDKASGEQRQEILWGASLLPLTFTMAGKTWTLELRRHAWQLPFSLTLKEFRRKLHPNTPMARSYESDVILTDGGEKRPLTIRMNEPLRHRGTTFFQASFTEDPQTGQFTSVFAVVRNPADHWPLYATVVITFGMLLHFGLKLAGHLRREKLRDAAGASGPAQPPPATV